MISLRIVMFPINTTCFSKVDKLFKARKMPEAVKLAEQIINGADGDSADTKACKAIACLSSDTDIDIWNTCRKRKYGDCTKKLDFITYGKLCLTMPYRFFRRGF
jgi:phosphoribosylcarboxyaminoimidazole (NCAIR) mutase